MKILVAHNRYRSHAPSGENKTVDAEIELLRQGGVQVHPLIEESDSIGPGPIEKLRVGAGPVYSPRGVQRFREALAAFSPDVVHIHNVFPLFSPWIVRAARKAGVPVVQTVHNYRHGCVNGLYFRDGHPCLDCQGSRAQLPGVIHGCYRGSRLQTLPMTISQNVHRSTWRSDISTFLALTPFMRDQLVIAGIPARKITIRPSWVPDDLRPVSEPPAGGPVLFIGRLEPSKGVSLLLDAWKHGGSKEGRQLLVAGDGPSASKIERYSACDPTLRYLGHVSRSEVVGLLDACAFVVMPSMVFEGYPLVMAEARSRGRAVLAVDGGSAASILDSGGGWVVPKSPEGLARGIRLISDDAAKVEGATARRHYESENSPQVALASLLNVYKGAVVACQRR